MHIYARSKWKNNLANPLGNVDFFAALIFLKHFGGTHFQEEKFTDIFK